MSGVLLKCSLPFTNFLLVVSQILILKYTHAHKDGIWFIRLNNVIQICVLFQDGDYVMEKEYEGKGLCPYDPDHNSTAVYSGKQNLQPWSAHLFSAESVDADEFIWSSA